MSKTTSTAKQSKADKDLYYEEQSRQSIEQAVKDGQGKSPEDTRFLIRRSYPFGALRKGRPYKIWNRLVLAKEVELGLQVRKHKKSADKIKLARETANGKQGDRKEIAKPEQSTSCVMRLGGCYT